jgi:hypothetical protein
LATKNICEEAAIVLGSSPTGISVSFDKVFVSNNVTESESELTTNRVLPSGASAMGWLDVELVLIYGTIAEEFEYWMNQSPIAPTMIRKMHNKQRRINLNAAL